MKCLNCGTENDKYLCEKCRTEDILDNIYNTLISYKEEKCDNIFVKDYAQGLTDIKEIRGCIPDILDLFDDKVSEMYYFKLWWKNQDPLIEEKANKYLNSHPIEEVNSQIILYYLLSYYLRRDLEKPRKWHDFIKETDNLDVSLYSISAEYFSMIGEYDIADSIIEKAIKYCEDPLYNKHAVWSAEKDLDDLEKRKKIIVRYRNGKPYCPKEDGPFKEAIAKCYEEKGISFYSGKKAEKISENDFEPIKEYYGGALQDYCAFWCTGAYQTKTIKCIYQIAAVKVREGKIVDSFQSYIRPWDGGNQIKNISEKTGIEFSVIDKADSVKAVMQNFLNFVGDDILISTDALGELSDYISRAARYALIKEIKNEFLDLLDVADDTDKDFQLNNHNRKYLLNYFNIPEGNDSLEKAKVNVEIYNKLLNYHKK